MALAKWRETSQNLFCPICMHHLLLFSLSLSLLSMHCWTETEYLHLDCYLGLSRGATASNESAPRQKLNLFTICSVDYIAMRIICIWWYITLHSMVVLTSSIFLFDQKDWRNWRKTLWNCGKIIWGDEILQLKFIEMGVKERVLATPQPTGGRDWFAKTSPRKHSNITIVVLQHNNTIQHQYWHQHRITNMPL